MNGTDVLRIRNEELHLTQGQLGQLLGVHPLTVSKWERGISSPNAHQVGLLASFSTAAKRQPDIGKVVRDVLVGAGIGLALFYMLRAAFPDEK